MSIADTTRGRLIALVQAVDDQREAIETFKSNRAEAKAQLETVIAEIRSTIKDPEADPRETMSKLAKLERQRIRRQLELDTVKANMVAAKGEAQLAASQILGILRDLRDGGDLFEQPGETIDKETGEVISDGGTGDIAAITISTPEGSTTITSADAPRVIANIEAAIRQRTEEAAQVLNDTGKVPSALSPTDASVAAIGAVVGVGPDDGRDAPSETWDNRLTVAPHVASKKINPACGDQLRQAGYSQLNDVQAVRVEFPDDWKRIITEQVFAKTVYKLTDRQLDGLDEAIEARLNNKGQ